jgi:hypothetical protein
LTGALLHRFFDVFWLRPLWYKQPAWVPWDQFNRDLWSAQYNFKQAKIDNEKDESMKTTRTVRSCFYLLPTIIISFFITDLLGAILTTYSREDVFYAERYSTWQYLIIFIVGLSAVNTEFIYAGNLLQFLSSLFSGGTYVEGLSFIHLTTCPISIIELRQINFSLLAFGRTLEAVDGATLQSNLTGDTLVTTMASNISPVLVVSSLSSCSNIQ